MSARATPVRERHATHGLECTMQVNTTVGHDLVGLLIHGGKHVITTSLAAEPMRVTHAFPEATVGVGGWASAAIGHTSPGSALAVLSLTEIAQAEQWPTYGTPVKRARGLAPVRAADGAVGWARIAVLGPVPRESNRSTNALYIATMSRAPAPPPPGTPVFRLEDGACIGLLVPPTTVTTPLSAPLCVVAAITEVTRDGE